MNVGGRLLAIAFLWLTGVVFVAGCGQSSQHLFPWSLRTIDGHTAYGIDPAESVLVRVDGNAISTRGLDLTMDSTGGRDSAIALPMKTHILLVTSGGLYTTAWGPTLSCSELSMVGSWVVGDSTADYAAMWGHDPVNSFALVRDYNPVCMSRPCLGKPFFTGRGVVFIDLQHRLRYLDGATLSEIGVYEESTPGAPSRLRTDPAHPVGYLKGRFLIQEGSMLQVVGQSGKLSPLPMAFVSSDAVQSADLLWWDDSQMGVYRAFDGQKVYDSTVQDRVGDEMIKSPSGVDVVRHNAQGIDQIFRLTLVDGKIVFKSLIEANMPQAPSQGVAVLDHVAVVAGGEGIRFWTFP